MQNNKNGSETKENMIRKNAISDLEGSTRAVFPQPCVLPFRLPFKQPIQTERGQYCVASCMNWEGLQLARGGSTVQCFLYLGGSFVFGLAAEMLGMTIGRGF